VNFSHLAPRVALINENRKLADGIELIKEDIFWPEGQWSIRRGEMVWSKTEGWKKYYEIQRADSRFRSAEDAIRAWENSRDRGCDERTE
jgi:hypothetical protein